MELLEDGVQSRPGDDRARRSLASLRAAYGYRVLEGCEARPELVRIGAMELTAWRRIKGESGAGAMFEREEG
jgi:hypothetical protein